MNSGSKYISFLISSLIIIFSIAVHAGNNSGKFELINTYPDQGAAINTLRSQLFFVRNNADAWTKMSPFYRTFYQKRDSITCVTTDT